VEIRRQTDSYMKVENTERKIMAVSYTLKSLHTHPQTHTHTYLYIKTQIALGAISYLLRRDG